jgi:Molybdenum cofactor biosynthesis enzyme
MNHQKMEAPLIDPFGRAVTYLRISVTDRCDFRCQYCMAENMTFLPKKDLLSFEELAKISSSFVGLGTRKNPHIWWRTIGEKEYHDPV